jgi:hypothetical protein
MISGGYAPNICREVDMSTHPYTCSQLIRTQFRLLARQASGQPSRYHGRCGRRHRANWISCRMFVASADVSKSCGRADHGRINAIGKPCVRIHARQVILGGYVVHEVRSNRIMAECHCTVTILKEESRPLKISYPSETKMTVLKRGI